MARRMRLSDRNVSRLRVEKSEYTVWDTRVTGLGVRVRPSGYQTFVFLDSHGGSSTRRTLGPVTLMGVEEGARQTSRHAVRRRECATASPVGSDRSPVSRFRHGCLEGRLL